VNISLGLFYSPITAPTSFRVQGAAATDQNRIRQRLQTLKEEPFVKINLRRLESDLQLNPQIRAAHVTLNPFGRGIVRIEAREPIARIKELGSLCLGSDGALFRTLSPVQLPILQLPAEELALNLTFFSTWEPLAIAQMIPKFLAVLPKEKWTIVLDAKGGICFNSESKCRLILGDSYELDEKLEVLRTVLKEDPNLLHKSSAINLTAPENPVRLPR